jgi:hypothetical protein
MLAVVRRIRISHEKLSIIFRISLSNLLRK